MKFKQLFESQFDTLSTSYGMFYFYKNPTSKEFHEKHKKDLNNKGVIDKDGNLFIVYFWPKEGQESIWDNPDGMMLHYDMVEYLQKHHGMFAGVRTLYMNRFQQHVILVQRDRETNNFYLSEIYMSSNLKSSKIAEILEKAKAKNPNLNFYKKRITDVL